MVQGRFCHICGQENIAPKETAWHLVTHFFQDITHFDGKFFSSLRHLLFRPGFLSREYMMGRRASYLNPIRMYIFTSAFFFLFFFSIQDKNMSNAGFGTSGKQRLQQQKEKLQKAIKALKDSNTVITDSSKMIATRLALAKFKKYDAAINLQIREQKTKDSIARIESVQKKAAYDKEKDSKKRDVNLNVGPDKNDFSSLMAYDTVQSLLPPEKRDGFWARIWNRKMADVLERATEDASQFGRSLSSKLLHSLPQLFFISLPIYAFLLWILYGRGKRFYYANHAIFSIHFYCAAFIIVFLLICISKLANMIGGDISDELTGIGFLILLFYQYKALRNFYQQRRAKTVLKFFLICIGMLIVLLLLTTSMTLISLWNI